jgi:abelson tyrosine-protein kinase 1
MRRVRAPLSPPPLPLLTPCLVTLPLWSPGPVALGDVGFLEKPTGAFRALFNAFDPERSSSARMRALARLQGYGDLKTSAQRVDRRNLAQRGLDALARWLPFWEGDAQACVRCDY